jgi:hypothetical protein
VEHLPSYLQIVGLVGLVAVACFVSVLLAIAVLCVELVAVGIALEGR